jgi:hypothetical protein
MSSAIAVPNYHYVTIPYNPEDSEVGVAAILPESLDANSAAITMEEHGPETYLLLSLRRQLIASLTQIHGFDNLTGDQRKLAVYLITRTPR